MKKEGYSWWIECIKAKLSMFDVLRIDHFRGFESYWAVPYGDETARGGKWVKGPGYDFISAINKAVPGAPIIAEDLGYLTPAVKTLLKKSTYPGMKVSPSPPGRTAAICPIITAATALCIPAPTITTPLSAG